MATLPMPPKEREKETQCVMPAVNRIKNKTLNKNEPADTTRSFASAAGINIASIRPFQP